MRWPILLSLGLGACGFPDFRVQEQKLDECATISAEPETRVCGEPCSRACELGSSCQVSSDCASDHCVAGLCDEQGCDDGVRNRDETDADCGGKSGCRRCALNQSCEVDADCDRALCRSGRCQPPSCNDGILNQDETDIDCGSINACRSCEVGEGCSVDADCDHSSCVGAVCEPAGCSDGIANGNETGTDCGGGCSPCEAGAPCTSADDCQSGQCVALLCRAPSCDDGITNGGEPTQDCGAVCPQGCGFLDACFSSPDCEGGVCRDQRCLPAEATGMALSQEGWVGTANATVAARKTGDALDDDPETSWVSGKQQDPGDWFQVDMLAPRAFFRIEVINQSIPEDAIHTFHLLVSEDGVSYTAATQTLSGDEHIVISFPEAQVARYLKLEALAHHSRYWRIDDLLVYR